jgi:hypothetical protein
MADQFGLTDAQYLSDAQRTFAADLSRAFDNSRQIQERTMQRYGVPALGNYQQDWALERARAMGNGANRMRTARQPITQSRAPQGRSRTGGLMQLLPLLMGRNGYNNLVRDGVIKFVRDAFGNPVAQPGQNYSTWLENNSFTTAEGNLALLGEDGQLRIVDPKTGNLLENVGANYQRDADGNIDFSSQVFPDDESYADLNEPPTSAQPLDPEVFTPADYSGVPTGNPAADLFSWTE